MIVNRPAAVAVAAWCPLVDLAACDAVGAVGAALVARFAGAATLAAFAAVRLAGDDLAEDGGAFVALPPHSART